MAAICGVCGLPDELCICQEIAKEQQRAILSTDRRRYGKIVTKVEGIDDVAIDINELAKLLKTNALPGELSKVESLNFKAITKEGSKCTTKQWIQCGGEIR